MQCTGGISPDHEVLSELVCDLSIYKIAINHFDISIERKYFVENS